MSEFRGWWGFRVTEWRFEGEPRTDGDPTSTTWAGPMVHPGTISISGKIGNGSDVSASLVVRIVARDWSQKQPVITAARISNDSPPLKRLPERVVWAHQLGHSNYYPEHDDPVVIGSELQLQILPRCAVQGSDVLRPER